MNAIHFHLHKARVLCWIAMQCSLVGMWFNKHALASSQRAQRLMDSY